MSVKFLAQGNIGVPLPMRLAILRLLVNRVSHPTTKPLCFRFRFNMFEKLVDTFGQKKQVSSGSDSRNACK